MRCPDCAKMVSYDTEADVETQSGPEVSGNTVTAEYRRVLTCAECGTELKEANFNLEMEITTEDCQSIAELCPDGTPHDWLISEEGTVEPTMESGSRYAKTFYGVDVYDGRVTCDKCKLEGYFKGSDKEAASNLDECV